MPSPAAAGPRPFTDLAPEEVAAWLGAHGYPASHAARLVRRCFGRPIDPHARFPAGLDERLAAAFPGDATTEALRATSADGTTKLLLRLADGRTIESVLMPDWHPDRAAGCLSSQVGCAMACDFCATAQSGFARNLTSGEIVEQFLRLREAAAAGGRTLRTIVFMGMGEPMLNLPAVLAAVRRIADPALGSFGWRQITVSTVGLVPGIDALTRENLGINLAISLHAPDDATRADLLPMGRRHSVADVLAAADRHQAASGRVTTIQYCLLDGVNDSEAQARDLARLVRGRRFHVNLLRYNPTGLSLRGRTYQPTPPERTEAFLATLRAHGAVAHLRRARGPDIDAACGQLRRRAAAS